MRLGREVDDVVRLPHQRLDERRVADVAVNEAYSLRRLLDVAQVVWVAGVRQLVEIDDAGVRVVG